MLIIGIAGGTGSGKTTVTRKILSQLHEERVEVLEHDSYYKDISAFGDKRIEEINFDHPDALDTPLLIQHLQQLRAGKSIEVPIYDFQTYTRRQKTRHVEPGEVIIVEGILIFVEKELRDLMDIKIYVDTDADERLLRRIRRDILERGRSIESIMQQYITMVKPMHLEFVEPSKRWADIIIPKGGENEIAIGMVVAKIQSLLRTSSPERA
ncbi:MAG: uridine kinase [Bacteroidota bacterium]